MSNAQESFTKEEGRRFEFILCDSLLKEGENEWF